MSGPVADRVEAQCTSCQARLRVPAAVVGKKARCPKCGVTFVVDAAPVGVVEPPGTPPQPAGADVTRFPCSQCQTTLKAPALAAGKKVRCKACGAVTVVPSASTPSDAAGADGEDLFAGLGAGTAASAPAPAAFRPCVACGAAAPSVSAKCPTCGADPITGQGARGSGASMAGAAAGALGGVGKLLGGTFVAGFAASAVCAVVGAGVWFGIAYATNYEIGWIAWGIGLIVGAGMYAGNRQADSTAGAVAALLAVASIVGAKVLLFYVVFQPYFEVTNSVHDRTEMLASVLANDQMEAAAVPIDPNEDWERWEAEFDRVLIESRTRVEAMSAEERETRMRQHRRDVLVEQKADEYFRYPDLPDSSPEELVKQARKDAREAARKQAEREYASMSDEEIAHEFDERLAELVQDIQGAQFWAFFTFSFAPADLIFFALAIATAYRIGGFGFGTS